jgi:hypothetical protein
MIIRHGEKPGDPNDEKDGGPYLSIAGSSRAVALPALFTPDPTSPIVNNIYQMACDVGAGNESGFTGKYKATTVGAGKSRFITPDFLFATEDSSASHRPVETITPLAQALGITINHTFTNTDDQKKGIPGLVSEVETNTVYDAKVILICWHHGTIPELVEAFGVPASQLPFKKWPGTVFDLIFSITWDEGQANLVPPGYQQLLYGDARASASATA